MNCHLSILQMLIKHLQVRLCVSTVKKKKNRALFKVQLYRDHLIRHPFIGNSEQSSFLAARDTAVEAVL